MNHKHSLLLRQLKKLGIDSSLQLPSPEQWAKLLDRISQAYIEADQERYRLERSQKISECEMQEIFNYIEEAQRIAGLGNWGFNRSESNGQWSEECYRIFGLSPFSSLPSYKQLMRQIHKSDRINVKDRIDAALHDGRDFEIEFRLFLADGTTRWIRAFGQPVKNSQGKIIRLHGTTMDVTRRKIVELRQSMEHNVTRILAESDSLIEAIPEIIQTICDTLGWVCGALWMVNKDEHYLQRAAIWSTPEPLIEQFYRASQVSKLEISFNGFLGSAILKKKPVWINDVSQDPSFLRISDAHTTGLRAAFAFPILAGSEIIGVMEFFNQQIQGPDQELLYSAEFIGRHIGQFFHRQQAEDALRESETHFRSLVEQASESFYVHDIDGNFIDVNQRGCDSLGYTRFELLGKTIKDIDSDLSISDLKKLLRQDPDDFPIARESRHKRKDGSEFPVEISTGPIEINGRKHFLSMVRDVTERKQMQDHIQRLAYHDALTNLPNRAMFNRNLNRAITRANQLQKRLAVLFIDLDRFKNINDSLGHDAGDRLLQEMASRLSLSVRGKDFVARSNSANELIARLGGDEFVVLIEDVKGVENIGQIAHRILDSMVEEYTLDNQSVHITASIGISIYPDDAEDEYSLMKHADIAMYRAKDRGKNNFQFYSAQMGMHSAELLALESALRRAIERNELVLHYQPKVHAKTGRITGAEALVRWQHPELGLVYPAHFIQLAEETGLIVPLSRWVLKEACKQNLNWQQQGLPPLRMAVNLSPRQFSDDNLVRDTKATLQEIGMSPSLLELEITEGMMMNNTEKSIQILDDFKALGIHIAIDDFGIGFSSLSHLKRFPIDIIKIDRSFIQGIPEDKSDGAITEAIIAMGKSLKIRVVAEGVETQEQLDFLNQRECEEIQGYYYSRPIPADAFIKLMWKNMAVSLSLQLSQYHPQEKIIVEKPN